MITLFITVLLFATGQSLDDKEFFKLDPDVPFTRPQANLSSPVVRLDKLTGTIYSNSFSMLPATVKTFWLEDASLEEIEVGALCAAPFEKIILKNNFFGAAQPVEPFGTQCLSVRKLKIDANYNLTFPVDFFAPLENLKDLSIARQPAFDHIPKGMFDNLVRLENFTVNFGTLRTIEKGALDALDSLKILDLFANGLESIDGVLGELKNLRRLSVRSNSLKRFPWEDVKNLRNLEYIDMDWNEIKIVDTDIVVRYLQKLKFFSFEKNLLDCEETAQKTAVLRRAIPNLEIPNFWC